MKTQITAPGPAAYLGSLLLAVILGVAAYLLLVNLSILDTAYFLAVGLVIGHLTGILFGGRSVTTPPAVDAEPVSLYVGNLAYQARDDALRRHFGQYGKVYSVRIMADRQTRKPRGYAFVEMDSRGANRAMAQLNDVEFFGRPLKVSSARQQTED